MILGNDYRPLPVFLVVAFDVVQVDLERQCAALPVEFLEYAARLPSAERFLMMGEP